MLTRASDITVQDMAGDTFLVRPDTGEIYHLDAMASAIWNAAAEPIARAELLDLFAEAFPDQDRAQLAADINAALVPLLEGGLLRETGPD